MRKWQFTGYAWALLVLLCSSAAGNGWGSGMYHVPLIEAATAMDEDGRLQRIERGAPVYVKFKNGEAQTSVRWQERPYERRVTLPRKALPAQLEGFRLYQEMRFDQAKRALEAEAAEERDRLVRNWKWVLAGHASLLAEPGAYDASIRLYESAAAELATPFAMYGAYFAARAMLAKDEYTAARERLDRLRRQSPPHDPAQDVLFDTYLLPNEELAAWSGSVPDLGEAVARIDRLIEAIVARERMSEDADDETKAAAMYAEARARADLWHHLPDKFYDWPRPERAVALMLETVKRFPDTKAAERAYYHYVFRYAGGEVESEEDIQWQDEHLRRMFFEKYPDSDLLEAK
jgi:hypothetical protein